MKTMNMKSMMLAAAMMIAMTASAATQPQAAGDKHHGGVVATTSPVHAQTAQRHGYTAPRPAMRECQCRDCRRARKALERHLRRQHSGRQNRMACRTCLRYQDQLQSHMQRPVRDIRHRR